MSLPFCPANATSVAEPSFHTEIEAMITGAMLIGQQDMRGTAFFKAVDPATGQVLEPDFASAGPRDVAQACALAETALDDFAMLAPEERARFLETIADQIAAIGDVLIERAMQETGLPRARLEGERGRTTGQLRLFAEVLRQGDWLDATIDPALPDRQPLPRPDIRRMNMALGPVAVFGASNFPLAFSVAGGDTASALAAGCPVVVKGHPAHPGTGELVARAIQQAVRDCGLPEGVFSYLPGPSIELGGALVANPRIKAVGFTGSRAGGLALMRIAADRPEPIPVYAEMSSINPVLLLPGALRDRAEELGGAFVQSLTMGAGQFCTNPGLLIGIGGEALDRFAASAAAALSGAQPATMLTPGIHAIFERGVDALERHESVSVVARGCVGEGINQARGALFRTSAEAFVADTALGNEVFGSSSILVQCNDIAEVRRVIETLEGQLTITLMMTDEDQDVATGLLPLVARKAGRVLANGWPTGVEVTHAMVHGGPYPATSDGRTTSVGSLAIARFLRPVCFQQMPDAILPKAIQDPNPWNLYRIKDGSRQSPTL
jgi:alpha-ketoglutaric semialdehyde dehydrogenase